MKRFLNLELQTEGRDGRMVVWDLTYKDQEQMEAVFTVGKQGYLCALGPAATEEQGRTPPMHELTGGHQPLFWGLGASCCLSVQSMHCVRLASAKRMVMPYSHAVLHPLQNTIRLVDTLGLKDEAERALRSESGAKTKTFRKAAPVWDTTLVGLSLALDR